MIATEFEYLAPSSLDEALSLLTKHGDEAKLLAGGHSLIPIMKLRLAQPKFLIDIGRVSGLADIREDSGAISVGSLATHHAVETSELLKSKLPLLPETAAAVGDVQVRNRGTIGGSLVHADPASDLPATALALGAELRVAGPRGQRSIKAEDFFVGLLTTAIAPDEILTEVRFPLLPAKTGAAYVKVRNKASHYAIVGVAAVLTLGGDGRCQQARIGLTGVTHKPQRASAAESALAGQALDDGVIAEAAGLAADGIKALSDIHASAEFRLHLAKVMTGRALKLALSRS
ncbi:MAG TPA: xanthine dehydrogenase family protein subunit M [Dehalococcoidia bacterium]